MEYFKLNNGIQMPMVGIGVFTFTPAEAQAAIESALRDGIRLIDTANAYQNDAAGYRFRGNQAPDRAGGGASLLSPD